MSQQGTEARPLTVAQLVAEYLRGQGVTQVYGLVGGHIQPIWDAVARAGIKVIDVRHEGAAVHMAQAHAELLAEVGVALVTAGPGLTNAMTAIANASVSRVPVLVISARPPRPQAGMGAMQELPQAEIVRPLVRRVEAVASKVNVLGHLDAALLAAVGSGTAPGPTMIDFPTDLLEEVIHPLEALPIQWTRRKPHCLFPDPNAIEAACQLIARSRRPVIISGRTAHSCGAAIVRYLDKSGAAYLDTGESRGAIPSDHVSYVPAMRARVMQEADLVITIGRRLDYQLAYGSPAIFREATAFLRIGIGFEETSENRRGDVEIYADAEPTLRALMAAQAFPEQIDAEWTQAIRRENHARQRRLTDSVRELTPDQEGFMHPLSLVDAINRRLQDDTIVVADGGDVLSFARMGMRAVRTLDCGSLGCLGVGVPFATAAALTCPSRQVFALIGDGAFGFSALELSTAGRHKAKVLFVIANNAGWNIDRQDQIHRYGANFVGVELPAHRYDMLAEGLGVYGQLVERGEQLDASIDRALNRLPALINVRVSREPTSPDFNNGLAEVPSHQALRKWDELEKRRYA